MNDIASKEDSTLRELARSLDCFTEGELQTLADATPNTVEAWRKRRIGPPYILFGRRYLYPRQEVADFLRGKVRATGPAASGKDLL